MNKIANTPTPRQLTPYAEETLRALTDGARRHGQLLDLDLSLPNLAHLLAAVLACSFHAALKRLHRLTQNERFDPQRLLLRRFERLACQCSATAHQRTLILVDWMSLGAFDLLVAAVALGEADQRIGRAMLLYAEAHPKDQLSGRKNRIEKRFLSRIRQACHLAAEAQQPATLAPCFDGLCFVFDRGFAKDALLVVDAWKASASSCGPTRTCVALAPRDARCSWRTTSGAFPAAPSCGTWSTSIRPGALGRR